MAELSLLQKPGRDDPRQNGLESVHTEVHKAPSKTPDHEAPIENEVTPPTSAERTILNTGLIIGDSSLSGTSLEHSESRSPTPTFGIISLFTDMIAEPADDEENELSSDIPDLHPEIDGKEMEYTVTQRFHNAEKYVSPIPGLSQINGFR